jgi:hypothetical protein
LNLAGLYLGLDGTMIFQVVDKRSTEQTMILRTNNISNSLNHQEPYISGIMANMSKTWYRTGPNASR